MIVPEFMRFYHYTLNETMHEYAIAFFTLVNSMFRLKAKETIERAYEYSLGQGGDESKSAIEKLRKDSEGLHGILNEVKTVKEVRGE